MRAKTLAAILALSLLPSCSSDHETPVFDERMQFLAKELLNSNWQKQLVGDEEWYYRMTVIEAPANTEAMGVAEGHFLHPELIRWEITKDMLIGLSTHASVLNSEHEEGNSAYRGAPLMAFPITRHFDVTKTIDGHYLKVADRPWQERRFIDVDWSQNLISPLKRSDVEKDQALSPDCRTSYMVDGSDISDPRRMRLGDNFIDVTARYPTQISKAATKGLYGLAFKEDGAAPVIDVRHFFMKKLGSDFVPLPSPDFVNENNQDGQAVMDAKGKPKKIAINRRFGLFRINSNGRFIHDSLKGTSKEILSNATIFNIWQKSHDQNGAIIPLAKREVKPIIYYMNVFHPEDLINSSYSVAAQWDKALRETAFYAQGQKYGSLDDVPRMFILKPNSCNIEELTDWLTLKRPDLKRLVEEKAYDLDEIRNDLDQAREMKKTVFTRGHSLELNAKGKLLKLCTALEFYTQSSREKFVYQRPGDLRFNLLNLEMSNNTTDWSGYGPMLADPITGEIISATTNINMKYIDLSAQKMSKQIGLLKETNPGLYAVFGLGVGERQDLKDSIDEQALISAREHSDDVEGSSLASDSKSPGDFFDANETLAISKNESLSFKAIENELAKEQERHEQKNRMMDPLKYVDNISIGIAIKFADLPEHERFLNIRSLIYQSVALHELGHNLGLCHNMAGASDVLNYGQKFWQLEFLPADINVAIKTVADPKTVELLNECLEQQNKYQKSYLKYGGRKHISTQDCLQQKNGMYSSIMDYHASTLADIEGLGAYDKAAIKWAYGQLLEVFPEESLGIDPKKVELSRWLKFNNYRHIPKVMLKSVKAIDQRKYVRFTWDKDESHQALPNSAVPYAYCDDPSGNEGPRCLAYDFGPDMKSSALWLKDRFWQQYLFKHFAKDQSFMDGGVDAITEDISNLKRFTNILRWYYRMKDDPEFKGSYAEKDYLTALTIGINHFAQVLGMPESGAHISAPNWKIEDKFSLPIDIDRTSAAKVLIPAKNLSNCDAKSVTSVDKDGQTFGRFSFQFAEVPLGVGRPLNSGFSDELENKLVLYPGSSLVKKYALYLLIAPLLSSHSPRFLEKRDLVSMTWYRMFPEAVSKIFAEVIANNFEELGPLVKDDGSIKAREIIDGRTHKVLSFKESRHIMPAMEQSIQLFAAEAIISLIPKTNALEDDLLKSISISCRGCPDEVDLDKSYDSSLAHYNHIFGQQYRAATRPDKISIGASLLERADRQKLRYLKLKACLADEQVRARDPFCQCVKTTERKTYADWVCCDENNESCLGPTLEKVGEGVCSLEDLHKRLAQSLNQLLETVGFIDGLRALIKGSAI